MHNTSGCRRQATELSCCQHLLQIMGTNACLFLGHSHPQRLHTISCATQACGNAVHHIMVQPAGGCSFSGCRHGGAPEADASSRGESSSVARLLHCAGVYCSAAAQRHLDDMLRQGSAHAAHGHIDQACEPTMCARPTVSLACCYSCQQDGDSRGRGSAKTEATAQQHALSRTAALDGGRSV
jgi:hypothetical protein